MVQVKPKHNHEQDVGPCDDRIGERAFQVIVNETMFECSQSNGAGREMEDVKNDKEQNQRARKHHPQRWQRGSLLLALDVIYGPGFGTQHGQLTHGDDMYYQ